MLTYYMPLTSWKCHFTII